MEGAGAAAATRMILEYLIIHLQYRKEEQPERFSTLRGTFVVSVDIKDSFQDVNQSHCATFISAKGDFCHKLLTEQMLRDLEGLPSLRQTKAPSGRGCPHESVQTMPFQFSFELCEKSGVVKGDCLAMKQFIRRISLVHTMIRFHYCVNVNGSISAETYSPEGTRSTCLPDGTKLFIDGSHFMRSASRDLHLSCDKIHPMMGEPVGLFIPDEVAERGFSGELRLTPVGALWPCWKPFPSQPVRIADQYIFLYDPAGLPVLFPTKEASCSFFEDPSSLAAWERYAYQATLNSDPLWEEDTAKPDVRYKLHTSHKEEPDTREQTLMLFLFLSYANQFQDKPVYNFWDRRVVLSYLCPILSCSGQVVKGAIQGVVNGILEQHYKAAEEQRKLAHSLPIMVDAISSIISSSTDSKFRTTCLQRLQVADTQDLQVTIRDTFNKVILKRWKPNNTCSINRPLPKNNETGQLSTDLGLSSGHNKLLCSYVGSASLEQGGSCGGEDNDMVKNLSIS
ncbi:type 2 DNA topoisomerase 6 subunit B-like [Elgaria multicarinata webbii]|uniref:type 2 DNA topoisomerase 6 subunit B-like n=1 Tax=Elgaria multicarinata webbii TaxID=159646 RepID=UPI002FCCEE32